jgi:hypothetical protein
MEASRKSGEITPKMYITAALNNTESEHNNNPIFKRIGP